MSIQQKIIIQFGIKPQLHLIFQDFSQNGSIYLSNFVTALHSTLLENHQICSILTVAKGCWIQEYKNKICQQNKRVSDGLTEQSYDFQNQKNIRKKVNNYMYVPITDKITTDITKHFQKLFQFIDRSRKTTNILIHCRAGISRSATVVIAYLMYKFSYSLQQAYVLVKNSCPKIKPNAGFINQLINFNKELYGYDLNYDLRTNTFFKTSRNKKDLDNEIDSIMGKKQKLCQLGKLLQKDSEIVQNKIKKLKKFNQIINNKKMNRSDYLKQKIEKYKIKKLNFTQDSLVIGENNKQQ